MKSNARNTSLSFSSYFSESLSLPIPRNLESPLALFKPSPKQAKTCLTRNTTRRKKNMRRRKKRSMKKRKGRRKKKRLGQTSKLK